MKNRGRWGLIDEIRNVFVLYVFVNHTFHNGQNFFYSQTEDKNAKLVEDQPPGNLPSLKPDDYQYFDKLLVSFME